MIMDLVHDTQSTFRELTEALSFPGKPVELSRWEAVDWDGSPHRTVVLLAQTLLDPETAFCFLGEESVPISKTLTRLTLARSVEVSQAPFLLVDSQASLAKALEDAAIGDLESPEKGATIIYFHQETQEETYRLTGPGIRDSIDAPLPLNNRHLEIRAKKNSEFPLGVDMIFCSEHGLLRALPRTTRVALPAPKEAK